MVAGSPLHPDGYSRPLSLCSGRDASSVHKYFREWLKDGVFLCLWRAGLAEYDEMEGIAWMWQSVDGSMIKAPMGTEAVGSNPTDRGKKREQATLVGGRAWRPAVADRYRGQPT